MRDPSAPSSAKGIRPEIDDVDREIVSLLADAARMPNSEIAARLGLAASTVHQRTRSLVERGVITGFHASIDQARLGRGIQAMIGVTLRPGSRQASIERFAVDIRELPQVLQVFFLGGADDYLVHVAVSDSSELREFVVQHLSSQPSVASTRTSIVFDYHRNAVPSPFQ